MPELLTPILPHVVPFTLVLFRLASIFFFAPMFSSPVIPTQVKALLALVLAFCVYPVVPTQAPVNPSMWAVALGIGGEVLIGLVIGYGASIPLAAMQLGGLLMGQQLGLGLGRVYNPDFDEEVDILGQILFLGAVTIFLLLDGHQAMMTALVHSFRAVPLGGVMPGQDLVLLATGLLTSMIDLAMRVSAPLLCLVFLETVALGFVSRTVPQMNLLNLGFPLRIIVGLGLIAASTAVMSDELAASMRQAMAAVHRVVTMGGM
jgi:flagellar biosynthetic protein FliR